MCVTAGPGQLLPRSEEKPPMSTIIEPTAAETYAAHRSDLSRLVDVLNQELDRHDDLARADPKNWE